MSAKKKTDTVTITLTMDELVLLTSQTDPFKTFVKNTLEGSGEPEPFCPFIFSGYCNDAYSRKCYECEHAVKDYYRIEDKV